MQAPSADRCLDPRWRVINLARGRLSLDTDGEGAIDRILRYQTTINRQLYQAINELERLQRIRKSDNVPVLLNLQVLHDTATISDEETFDQSGRPAKLRNEAKKLVVFSRSVFQRHPSSVEPVLKAGASSRSTGLWHGQRQMAAMLDRSASALTCASTQG